MHGHMNVKFLTEFYRAVLLAYNKCILVHVDTKYINKQFISIQTLSSLTDETGNICLCLCVCVWNGKGVIYVC
jgi:hypothetical protein